MDRPTTQELVLSLLPTKIRTATKEVIRDPQLNEGITETMGRWQEFSSPTAAMFAGLWMVPETRSQIDDQFDRVWKTSLSKSPNVREVIVGGGLQAAIYSAIRVANGFPPPVVLEKRKRVGGTFAISKNPSFYLNSRNRPGPLSVPGQYDGSLNVIPGAPVQPADLGGEEFQTNDVLGWVIRLTLAMNAIVVPEATVNKFVDARPGLKVVYNSDRYLYADRVLVADGLGMPKNSTGLIDDRVINFEQFMAKMDSPFPLRGMNRVAVIGSGDGAKTAIEALTGQGPRPSMSVASLDRPQVIEWFGAPYYSRAEWERCNRSRYLRIGSLLPETGSPISRVTPKKKTTEFASGYDCMYVNEIPFDFIIDCTGYDSESPSQFDYEPYEITGRTVATRALPYSIFKIGPSAALVPTKAETNLLRNVAENTTSSFRYSGRTALLASTLL